MTCTLCSHLNVEQPRARNEAMDLEGVENWWIDDLILGIFVIYGYKYKLLRLLSIGLLMFGQNLVVK